MRTIIPKKASLIPKDATCVFKGIIFDTYQWEQKLFDGSTKTFEMLKRPDTVKVIAIKDNKMVVLNQEQPGMSLFYDVPGGRHDEESETELEAAKRELVEETGLSFRTWRLISVWQPLPKIEQFVYEFLAYDLESEIAAHPDAGEKIDVQFLTLDEVKTMMNDPKNRYLPKEILEKVNTIDDLLTLPEYQV